MHGVFRSAKAGKFGFEEGNGARRFGKHSVDRLMDNLSISSAATFKGEIYGATGLYSQLRTTTENIERYPCQYCSIFYPGVVDSLNRDFAWQRDFKQSSTCICSETEICDITNEEDNLNESMFIGVIDISEERQGRVACTIWLQTANDCPLIVGETDAIAPNTPGSSGSDIAWTGLFESTFRVTDWERDRLIKGRILENPELPEQMVKRRTQVVAGVSDEQWKICGDGFKLLKTEHSFS